jgi:hypothetical protein
MYYTGFNENLYGKYHNFPKYDWSVYINFEANSVYLTLHVCKHEASLCLVSLLNPSDY